MKRTKQGLIALFAVLVMGVCARPSAADTIFELNKEFSGATQPSGTAPWLRATFTTTGVNEVTLTLESLLQGSGEYVGEWDFNLNTLLDPTKLVFTPVSGKTNATISTGVDAFKADGDGLYDIKLDFPQKQADRWGFGDTAVYKISLTGGNLVDTDFDFLSAPDGGHGPFLTAAHVQGIGDDGQFSGWITVVEAPEPASMAIAGMGIVGFAGYFGLRRKRSS
jgi:hypothetical protein